MQRLISARAGEGTYRGSFQEWAWRGGLCGSIDQVDWQQVEDLAGELFELLSILVFAHQTFLNSNSKKFEKIVAIDARTTTCGLYCFGTFFGTCGTWELGSGVSGTVYQHWQFYQHPTSSRGPRSQIKSQCQVTFITDTESDSIRLHYQIDSIPFSAFLSLQLAFDHVDTVNGKRQHL